MTTNMVETDRTYGQSLVLDWTSITFFAAVHALALLAPWFFSWSALGVAIFLHWLFGSMAFAWGIIDC